MAGCLIPILSHNSDQFKQDFAQCEKLRTSAGNYTLKTSLTFLTVLYTTLFPGSTIVICFLAFPNF